MIFSDLCEISANLAVKSFFVANLWEPSASTNTPPY
jgi:hypothetical protein